MSRVPIIFGLLKLDSAEFWKAIFQRFKKKRATLGIDIKDLEFKENSLLVLGQVPWDLNSVVYGLNGAEYINEIRSQYRVIINPDYQF